MLSFAATGIALAEQQQPGSAPSDDAVRDPLSHPLELEEAVTNEHTAMMTLARAAALEYYQAGKYKLAEAKFIVALEQAKLGFDVRDPHIASCKNNLAEFYRNTGQFAKAEALYTEALELLDFLYGEKHWLYVGAMHNLALCYEAGKDYTRAAATMEKVLKLRLQMFGDRSFLYADSMFALAHIIKKLGGKGADVRALQLMRKAIEILEDAESLQVNVVLFWLQDMAKELRAQGRPRDAAEAMSKALKHMASDKGEVMASASALSDALVDDLIEAGQLLDARKAMSACLSARVTLFKRDLVVVQSMTKMASIDAAALAQESALEHASGAASLAEELLKEYSASPGWGAWLGGDPKTAARTSLKRVQAAHLLGNSLRQLASLQAAVANGAEGTLAAERSLRAAVVALQDAAQQALDQLAAAGPAPDDNTTQVDELSSLYVESMLAVVECYEKLAELLAKRGDATGAAEALQQCEDMAKRLVA
ncbi:hypothetical protein FOA52_011489 [Chlamydomonas sp. UWO 241]|nr:hypothetical protein FOA52_011489 [Chlamydomonas sp. UWO 241]